MIATGPFVGCAGADPGAASQGNFGGTGTETGTSGGAVGVTTAGGKSTTNGGSAVSSAGTASSGGATSNPFFGGGSSAGGNPFASAGSLGSPAGTSSGGTSVVGAAGTGVVTGPANPGEVVANVSEIPLGSFQIVGGLFFMGRDAGGVYAMSMQCTHKFCALVIAGTELDCPCHHSRFDRAGNVLVGPATDPLPYYKVYVDAAGNLSVDKYAVVSRSTRLAISS